MLTHSSPNGDQTTAQKATAQNLVDLWNRTVTKLPKVKELTDERRKAAARRLKKHPDLAWWERAFRAADASPFHSGDNDRGWRADFDWFVKNDTNTVKVLERATRRTRAPSGR